MFCSCDTNGDGVLDFDEFQQGLERAQTIANESFFAMRKLPAARGDEPTRLVALVAHNNMKPSMMNFVAKYIDFFKTVSIVTTGSTGSALEKKLGLTVACKVASGPLGGDQEIGGMITNDAVAAAFFFIDPLSGLCPSSRSRYPRAYPHLRGAQCAVRDQPNQRQSACALLYYQRGVQPHSLEVYRAH